MESLMTPNKPYCPHTWIPESILKAEKQLEAIEDNPPKEIKGFSCYLDHCDLNAEAGSTQCEPLAALDGQKRLKCPCCPWEDIFFLTELTDGQIHGEHDLYYMMPIERKLDPLEIPVFIPKES